MVNFTQQAQHKPAVTVRTLQNKLEDGFDTEGIMLVGVRGSITGSLKPLIQYLRKAGIEVKE
jgi:hypothetical protein